MATPGPSSENRYFCRRCRYELTGLGFREIDGYPQCPECGSLFRPGDPETTTPTPHGPVRRFVHSRAGKATLAMVLLLVGYKTNVLPRPVRPFDGTAINWSHWEWFGVDHGTQRLPSAWGGTTPRWVNWEVTWRWGRVRAVRVVEAQFGTVIWSVDRGPKGVFRLDVDATAVDWSDLLTGLNAVSRPDEFLGVTIDGDRSVHQENPRPFSVTGTKQEVIGEMVRQYGLAIRTLVVPNNHGDVWVFDAEAQAMRLVSVQEASEMGYDPARDDQAVLPRPFWN